MIEQTTAEVGLLWNESAADRTERTQTSNEATNAGAIKDMLAEIRALWSRGTGSTLELARAVARFRGQLPYGIWPKALKSLPFAKRTANMLVTVGSRLSWLDGQTFAHLPSGWSVLYQLALLDREPFEKLLQEGRIHPKLTLAEANTLVAAGRLKPVHSRKAKLLGQIKGFGTTLLKTLATSDSATRAAAILELRRLLDRISAEGAPVDGNTTQISIIANDSSKRAPHDPPASPPFPLIRQNQWCPAATELTAHN